MSALIDALERIETWLVQNQPELAIGLQPGLTLEEINGILKSFPYQLSEEVCELYQWHNGKRLDCFNYFIPSNS